MREEEETREERWRERKTVSERGEGKVKRKKYVFMYIHVCACTAWLTGWPRRHTSTHAGALVAESHALACPLAGSQCAHPSNLRRDLDVSLAVCVSA